MLLLPPPASTTRHRSATFEDDPVQEPADHQEDLMHSSFDSDLSNTTDQYEEFRDDILTKKATLPIVEAYQKNLSACFPSRRATNLILDQLQPPSIDVSQEKSQASLCRKYCPSCRPRKPSGLETTYGGWPSTLRSAPTSRTCTLRVLARATLMAASSVDSSSLNSARSSSTDATLSRRGFAGMGITETNSTS